MKTVIRMYSGEVYHVQETLEEITGLLDVIEPGDHGFIYLAGRIANKGGTERAPKQVRLKIDRIESLEER